MGATVYLRPPVPRRPRKAETKTATRELSAAAFRYRVQFVPFLISFFIGAFATLLGPMSRYGTWANGGTLMALAAWATAALIYFDRVPARYRLDRKVERWYATACATVAGAWCFDATLGAGKPGPQDWAVLVLGTTLCAAPWWYHRRIRGSIPVRFHELTSAERAKRLKQARRVIRDWHTFTDAANLKGAKLRGIYNDTWSVILTVELRRGATVREFTAAKLEALESAFDGTVRAGSSRVERINKLARLANVRFMLKDPHAKPIKPPENNSTFDRIILGLFETGEEVLFRLVNTLIAGATGAGKSGVVNVLIRALSKIPNVAIIGIDLKPGAPELGPWRSRMHTLATTPEEVQMVLARLRAGLVHRGDLMAERGWRKWKPTVREPFIVVIIDEFQELNRAGLAAEVESQTALVRAFGAAYVICTQYPKDKNVSTTIREQCRQKIGLYVENPTADRVIFGEGASRNGWTPSEIDSGREGSLLIRSPEYRSPLLARAYWMDDDDVARDAKPDPAAVSDPGVTLIDDGTWTALERMTAPSAGDVAAAGGSTAVAVLEKVAGEIVDAIVVEDDPADQILAAIGSGPTGVKHIVSTTGLPRSSVYRHLDKLRSQGHIASGGRGVYVRTGGEEGEGE